MNFDQLVIREFLKINPSITIAPEILKKERNLTQVRGLVYWKRNVDTDMQGSEFYNAEVPDLATLFKNIPLTMEVWKLATHRDIAQQLFDYYGIVAEITDIVNTAISYDPLPTSVTLVATGTALSLKGSVTVNLVQKVKDIDDIIGVKEVDAVVDRYPLNSTRLVLEKAYYGFDFTEYRDQLKTYAVGFENGGGATPFFNILNAVAVETEMDKDIAWGWASSVRIAYDTNGMYCRYNGPASGHPNANPEYTHVCVWQDTRSTNASGYMYWHYNR